MKLKVTKEENYTSTIRVNYNNTKIGFAFSDVNIVSSINNNQAEAPAVNEVIDYDLAPKNLGTLKMPTDTMFYHLTRMSHMSLFCVGCGQCTSACPNSIDLMPAFRTAAQKTQARFEYQAGRSHDEKQPLTVFENDELVEVTPLSIRLRKKYLDANERKKSEKKKI